MPRRGCFRRVAHGRDLDQGSEGARTGAENHLQRRLRHRRG